MNSIFYYKGICSILSIASVAVISSGTSAFAQTVEGQNQQVSVQGFTLVNSTDIPRPGTTIQSSAALKLENTQAQTLPQAQPATEKIAQADIDVGTPTTAGASYVGIAGNIGIGGGDSSLGDGNFAVVSKIRLTNKLSARPGLVLGDNSTILLPVSWDFSIPQTDPFAEPLAIAPYVGGGAAIKTGGGDDSQVAFLLSGGVDVPLNQQFTAVAQVNAGFFDQTDVGLIVGVGYNFRR